MGARFSYANVMSTLAVFLVLAGGSAIAAGKLKRNVVKSKHIAPDAVRGVDANESSFGQVPLAAQAGIAGTANAVAADAVDAAGIQNPTRSIALPLTGLLNTTDNEPIDYTVSDGTAVDFVDLSGPHLVIEWDDDTDGGGTNVADTDSVGTTFLIPPDYASGGTLVARISKDGHTGLTERFRGFLDQSVGGGATGFGVSLTSAASTLYTLGPTVSMAPGDSAFIQVSADAGTGFGVANTADNVVRLEGLAFRYTAAQ